MTVEKYEENIRYPTTTLTWEIGLELQLSAGNKPYFCDLSETEIVSGLNSAKSTKRLLPNCKETAAHPSKHTLPEYAYCESPAIPGTEAYAQLKLQTGFPDQGRGWKEANPATYHIPSHHVNVLPYMMTLP
ncbi:hypothetical protein WISP_55796 [Willisornis vidua]|uniref:Uncharacterized protein n=1 Tax=Willisornis vidua TaxID=1566151 RepID=A0ABQ9DI08_9PASS|nr:hypothetical protein WISP_55796 [Willisornis vidua]